MKQPSLVLIPFAEYSIGSNVLPIIGPLGSSYRTTTAYEVGKDKILNLRGVNKQLRHWEGDKVSYKSERENTNYYIWSSDFSNGAHSKNNVVFTSEEGIAPNGKLESWSMKPTTEAAVDKYSQQLVTSGSLDESTFSIYAKNDGSEPLNILLTRGTSPYTIWGDADFNLTSGTVVENSNGIARIEDAGNGWYRVSVSGTPVDTGAQIIRVGTGSTATYLGDGVQLWGGQFETNRIPTSLITTDATPTFKNDDQLLIYESSSNIFTEHEGAFYFDLRFDDLGDALSMFTFNDTTTNNRVQVRSQANGSSIMILVSKDSDLFTYVHNVDAYSKNVKVMVMVDGYSSRISVNGTIVAVDTSTTLAFSDVTRLVNANTDYTDNSTRFSGIYTDIRAYPMKITDEEANYLTSV